MLGQHSFILLFRLISTIRFTILLQKRRQQNFLLSSEIFIFHLHNYSFFLWKLWNHSHWTFSLQFILSSLSIFASKIHCFPLFISIDLRKKNVFTQSHCCNDLIICVVKTIFVSSFLLCSSLIFFYPVSRNTKLSFCNVFGSLYC